jgi:hypothetical protein
LRELGSQLAEDLAAGAVNRQDDFFAQALHGGTAALANVLLGRNLGGLRQLRNRHG